MASNVTDIAGPLTVGGVSVAGVIRGKIQGSDGAVLQGSGFTCARNSTGSYTITLSVAMTNPVVVLCPIGQSTVIGGYSTSSTSITVTITTPSVFVDNDFTFMVMPA